MNGFVGVVLCVGSCELLDSFVERLKEEFRFLLAEEGPVEVLSVSGSGDESTVMHDRSPLMAILLSDRCISVLNSSGCSEISEYSSSFVISLLFLFMLMEFSLSPSSLVSLS